jgi:hypothetical protein
MQHLGGVEEVHRWQQYLLADATGGVVRVSLVPVHVVAVSCPETAREVLHDRNESAASAQRGRGRR